MSAQFAKIYETDAVGQIAVIRCDEDGKPSITLYFNPEVDGIGVCSISLGFGEGQDDLADSAFQKMSEAGVTETVAKHVAMIRQSFGEAS